MDLGDDDLMSFLQEMPSFNPTNFSSLININQNDKPQIPVPKKKSAKVYTPTHSTSPPENQVITTDQKHILLKYLDKRTRHPFKKRHPNEIDEDGYENASGRKKKVFIVNTEGEELDPIPWPEVNQESSERSPEVNNRRTASSRASSSNDDPHVASRKNRRFE